MRFSPFVLIAIVLLELGLPWIKIGLNRAFRGYLFHDLLTDLLAQEADNLRDDESDLRRKEREARERILRRRFQGADSSVSLVQDNEILAQETDPQLDIEEILLADKYDFSFSPYEYQRYLQSENLREVEGVDKSRGFELDYGDVKMRIYGRTSVKASYGESFYLSKNDMVDDTTIATSPAVRRGFDLNMDMKVSIKGKIGRKVTVDIDFDKNERQSENTFKIQYKALRKREFVQEVTLGNIDLKFPKSEFAVFDQRSKKTVGLEGKMERGKIKFHTIATLTQGETAVDRFTGSTRISSALISEYKFTPRKYYQLEPFQFYLDGCNPALDDNSFDRTSAQAKVTLTSSVADPSAFFPLAVNIDSGSLKVYMDDRDSRNDLQLGALPFENLTVRTGLTQQLGNYHRLQEGREYAFNPLTGRIVFLRYISEEHRIFVQYTKSGSTCDPTAYVDGISGTIETFLKWDRPMSEYSSGVYNPTGAGADSIIPDTRVNLDIYEVRSIYDLGSQNVQQAGFLLTLLNRSLQPLNRLTDLGANEVDFINGTIRFSLREPFKNLKDSNGNYILPNSAISGIYSERQPSFVNENTESYIRADFTSEVRNYRLSRTNIIRGSVIVRLNNIIVPESKYYVDYTSGFFTFINPNDPLIGPNSQIEVTYEYSPFTSTNQGFIVGLRTDYEVNRSVKIGSTILYNGQFEPSIAPRIGEEPISRLVLEGDITIQMNEDRVTRFVNTIPGADFDLLPVKFYAYGEAARSYHNPNTFGFALVDDMESSEETNEVEISEKDWQLASPPINPATLASFNQCNRIPLLYKYYRDPDDIRRGLLDFAAGFKASPLPEEMSGPYNVAEGHLDPSQLNISQAERQVSLVMDFDFSAVPGVSGTATSPWAGIVTRSYNPNGADFANISFLEFNARIVDAIAVGGIRVYMDIGTVNEDADGNGIINSEDFGRDGADGDINGNGLKDSGEVWDEGERDWAIYSERDSGISEDRGYAFSSPSCSYSTRTGAGPNISGYPGTRGNGALNSEDLDRDGKLTTGSESVLTFGSNANSYLKFDKGTDNTLTPGEWKLFRIQLDTALLTAEQTKALRQVRSIRLYIVPDAGSESGMGKFMIDGIKFGGSKWRKTTGVVGGTPVTVTDPTAIAVTTIDNFSSKDEYRDSSFLQSERGEYEKLHGKKTNTEYARIKEAALKINFDLGHASGPYSTLVARRVFLNSMDMRYYGAVSVWVNFRSLPAQTDFVFRVGSSDIDYYEFTAPVGRMGWQKFEFEFGRANSVSGFPNLKEVNTMQVGVSSALNAGQGELWLNDIFVSKPQVQTDDAHKYETSVEITKPMYVTESGVPILSDIKMLYKARHRGRRFASIGQLETNLNEDRNEFSISSRIMPFWMANYSFVKQSTQSDPDDTARNIREMGSTETIDHSTEHRFAFENPNVPQVTAAYQYRNYRNERIQRITSQIGLTPGEKTTLTTEDTWSPALSITELFPEVIGTKVKYQVKSSVRFYKRDEFSSGYEPGGLNQLNEFKTEKEQTEDTSNSLSFDIGKLNISPSYSYRQALLVNKNFTDTVNLALVNGDFYSPWVARPADFRYRQRMTKYDLQTSYQKIWAFTPSWSASATYQENSFRDNLQTYTGDKYQRLKQPSTIASTRLATGIEMKEIWDKLTFIKTITPGFTREVTLNENSVPFSSQTSVYDDKYGLSRTMPPVLDRSLNVFSYPFWHHFSSPGRKNSNYGAGRDYVQNNSFQLMSENSYENAFVNYDNGLSLRESLNAAAQWDIYKPLNLRTDVRLGQNVQRANIKSLPVQQVNWGFSVLQTYDLMQFMNFWFWKDKAKHSSTFDANLNYDRTMRVTENIREDRIGPSTGLTFNWFGNENALSSIILTFGINYRIFNEEKYLTPDGSGNDRLIYATIPARPMDGIRQQDTSYDAAIEYRTEFPKFRGFLQRLTGLTLRYNPRYSVKLSGNINRYDYDIKQLLSRPSLDQYILYNKLDINLHANVTGDIDFKTVWDVYRDPNTRAIRQEILSFQIGFGARILF